MSATLTDVEYNRILDAMMGRIVDGRIESVRHVVESILTDRLDALTAERDRLEKATLDFEREWIAQKERAEKAEAELRQRELHHFETEQENAALRETVDRVKALANGADLVGYPGAGNPTRKSARAVVIDWPSLRAALGVTE